MNASINMYSQSRLDVMAPGPPSLLKVYITNYLFYIMLNFGVCNSGKIPCVAQNILGSMGIDVGNDIYYKSSHRLPNMPICPDQWMPSRLSMQSRSQWPDSSEMWTQHIVQAIEYT